MDIHKDDNLRKLFDNLQHSVISSISEKIPITTTIDKHNHGPCNHIIPTCSYCMLHGNIFAASNDNNDKDSIVNTYLLQN